MAVPQDLQDVLNKIDADTTAVANTVKALDALISTAMTQTDVDAVKATLSAVATRLEGIAADPNVPVPPGPPPAPPVQAKKK